jgi:hypothetical protein
MDKQLDMGRYIGRIQGYDVGFPAAIMSSEYFTLFTRYHLDKTVYTLNRQFHDVLCFL